MADQAHEDTDKLISKLERKLKKEYKQAQKDLEEKLAKHLEKYQKDLAKKQTALSNGKITEQKYKSWLNEQASKAEYYKNMVDVMSEDLYNAHKIACGLINDEQITVFALNHNFATYEIEKGLNANLSYTLYDRETVKLLVKDKPDLLRKVDPKKKELKKWSKAKFNSAILQGVLQGESIPQIAKRVEQVTQSGYKMAVRNARTAMTYAENSGRQHSYDNAEKMGIKLKKAWLATLDNRTRHEHRLLDGQTVGIHESFQVDGKEIECPGDPKAAPELTWNCRCTLVGQLEGFENDLAELSLRNTNHMTESTYEEWKHAKEKQAKKEAVEAVKGAEKVKNELTFSEKIKQIRSRVSENGLTEDDLLEAGRIVSQEVSNLYGENLSNNKEEMDKLSSMYSILKKDYEKAERKADKLLYDIWGDRWQKYGFATREEAEAEYERLAEILNVKKKPLNEIAEKYLKLKESVPRYYNSAENLKNILSEVREMGSSDYDIVSHLRKSRSPMAPIVEEAYSYYPTDWVKASVDRGTLKVKKTSRGYYNDYYEEIAISGWDKNGQFETAIHELGHRYERAVPNLRDMEKIFYDRRTAGEELEWLGSGYDKSEVSRKDDFLNAYMGKDYGGNAYELVSMGFEYAYTDPLKLAQDPDMEAWIYGILSIM